MRIHKTDILISVCIPAYNRRKQLLELVRSVLEMNRKDIDVVVTDNCSTDGTREALAGIKNPALKVFTNEKPLPALSNMIQAIFNGDGKYIFYCNDRDLIVTEAFYRLAAFLEHKELSFVYTTKRKQPQDLFGKFIQKKQSVNSGHAGIFKKGYESLMCQDHTHHPTGMVFHGELIRKYLYKENYFRYLYQQFEYSFLMRDLLKYADSAILDYGCWDERPASFLMKSKSKTVERGILYFYPQTPSLVVKATLKQTLVTNDYGMSEAESVRVGMYILRYFYGMLIQYKYCMADIRETAHYGIDRKFISTAKMLRIFQKYFYITSDYLKEHHYSRELVMAWEREYGRLYREMIGRSMKADIGITRRAGIRKKEIRKSRS